MIKIQFKEMKVEEKERGLVVLIEGQYRQHKIPIEIAVLQLAKIFQSDKEVLKELEEETIFGTDELDNKCKETMDLVKKFPDIKLKQNEIRCHEPISKIYPNPIDKVIITSEDINGWNNEGILVYLPPEIYEKEIKDKKLYMFLKQDCIEIR